MDAHANVQQVDAIRNGTALILSCRKARRYDAAAMDASAKLLQVVPEVGMNVAGSILSRERCCTVQQAHPWALLCCAITHMTSHAAS
eukprot:365355-Chlamydomonas_euryale.AAC.12